MEPLKEKARAVGGNAIIIDKSHPSKSGIISTGISDACVNFKFVARGNQPTIGVFSGRHPQAEERGEQEIVFPVVRWFRL
jgi:hypothetical protein